MFGFFRKKPDIKFPRILIVGLGNPGKKYKSTRHNIGFEIILEFASRFRFPRFKKQNKALVSILENEFGSLILAMPQTFMNLSGVSIKELLDKYNVDLENFLLVHDDLSMPLGQMRHRTKGSNGGHNGLKSVEHCLGTANYCRLKFGIGRPEGEVIDFVLGNWNEVERKLINGKIPSAITGVEHWYQYPNKRELLNSLMNKE